MRIGVTLFATDQSIDVVDLARAVEERGLDSLWLPEHTHIPTSRRTPWPGIPGEELPEMYKRSIDPIVGMAAAAAVTTRLRVGTGILLPAQRDPIVTAKALASVDRVSGGRMSVGVGFGWNREEIEHHGLAFRDRRAVAREHVLAMRRLWEDDEASFDGDHVRFDASWSWPKPVQHPVPVLLGGIASDTVFDHVVEYANGWIPIGGSGLRANLTKLRDRFADAGRDPDTLEVVPFYVVAEKSKLDHYAELGATECVLQLPSAPRDEVLGVLDDYVKLLGG